jgi:hypothetical protein
LKRVGLGFLPIDFSNNIWRCMLDSKAGILLKQCPGEKNPNKVELCTLPPTWETVINVCLCFFVLIIYDTWSKMISCTLYGPSLACYNQQHNILFLLFPVSRKVSHPLTWHVHSRWAVEMFWRFTFWISPKSGWWWPMDLRSHFIHHIFFASSDQTASLSVAAWWRINDRLRSSSRNVHFIVVCSTILCLMLSDVILRNI